MRLGRFLVGIGLGALAGVFLAPKKGSELREDVKTKSQDLYEKVRGLSVEDLQQMLNGTVDNVKKAVDEFDADDLKASTKEKFTGLQDKLQELSGKVTESEPVTKVKESVADVTNKINEKVEEIKKTISEQGNDVDTDKIEEEIAEAEQQLDDIIEEIKS